ncbi:MAG: DUF1533 domain-containing protein [Ignavibacteriaceae bacterium]|nr:DUF1533 domain-containing protein [Ignavibacteriaceae bacterium]
MKTLYILLLIISLTAINQGQVLFNSNNTSYSTNFDFLQGSGTFNSYPDLIVGTYWRISNNRVYFYSSTLNLIYSGIYNFGSDGSTERSFGSRTLNSTLYKFALPIKNGESTKSIKFLKIQYHGEQWRSFSGVTQGLLFDYKKNPTSINDADYISISQLCFYPVRSDADAALDGNLSENQTAFSYLAEVDLPAGDSIYLRWYNTGKAGLAIDDLTVTAYYTDFPLPPAISPDVTLNTVDNDMELTFTDDLYWRENITSVEINNQSLSPGDYTLSAGKISLHPSNGNDSLKAACIKNIVVNATGFNDASVSQEILPGTANAANSTVTVSPALGQGVLQWLQ